MCKSSWMFLKIPVLAGICAMGALLFVSLGVPQLGAQTSQKPLTQGEVIELLKGDVPPSRVGEIARGRGISFEVTAEAERGLRDAGASEDLIKTLRQLAPPPAPAGATHAGAAHPGATPAGGPGRQLAKISQSGVTPTLWRGACPHEFKFHATIWSESAGDVHYTWVRSDGSQGATKTLHLGAKQKRAVVDTWNLSAEASSGNHYRGWEQLKIDSPHTFAGPKIVFNLYCSK